MMRLSDQLTTQIVDRVLSPKSKNFHYLGAGASREVFAIGKNAVIKIPIDLRKPSGKKQTELEIMIYNTVKSEIPHCLELLAEIYAYGYYEGNIDIPIIFMQRADDALDHCMVPHDFSGLGNVFYDFYWSIYKDGALAIEKSNKFHTILEWTPLSESDLRDCNLGVITRNGVSDLVIIDYGYGKTSDTFAYDVYSYDPFYEEYEYEC